MTSILVVEDDVPLQQFLTDVLTDEGYQVLVSLNREAALRVLQTERPTLILTDIMMPGMDGITFCERVQANPETAPIPIVVCSAGTLRPARDRCQYAAFLEKPFDLMTLLDCIHQVLTAPAFKAPWS